MMKKLHSILVNIGFLTMISGLVCTTAKMVKFYKKFRKMEKEDNGEEKNS